MNFWTGVSSNGLSIDTNTAGTFQMGSLIDDEQSYPSEHPPKRQTAPRFPNGEISCDTGIVATCHGKQS